MVTNEHISLWASLLPPLPNRNPPLLSYLSAPFHRIYFNLVYSAYKVPSFKWKYNGVLCFSQIYPFLFVGEKPSTPLFGSLLNREWEIVTVEEMRRRLSLSELSLEDLPLPEGAISSRILDEPMIRHILEILPARAEGYPWVMVSFSFFSRTTLAKVSIRDRHRNPSWFSVVLKKLNYIFIFNSWKGTIHNHWSKILLWRNKSWNVILCWFKSFI